MRVSIPDFAEKSQLYAYLKANKEKLISQKKSMPIHSEAAIFAPSRLKTDSVETKFNNPVSEETDVLRVKVVANTANWVDSHMDLMLPDSYKKSVTERKYSIPHLHDHIHQIDAKIGEVVDVYVAKMSFSELGIPGVGTTEALIFITDVMKSYNEKVFNQYKAGRINQHSIGLQYVKIELAINDPDSEKEFDFWSKYYDQIINKEAVDTKGYFWVVSEAKIYENSAVLFGSNEVTPTLDNNVKTEPGNTTQQEPPLGTQMTKAKEGACNPYEFYSHLLK